MANLTSTLTVRMIDAVSGPARAAAASILGIGKAAGAANTAGMTGFGAALATQARNMEKVASRLRSAASSMSTISFPVVGAGIFGARSVYNLEKTMNTIEAVTSITEKQRESLQNYIASLNTLFPFTNAQIAQSALELGRAGLSFEQIMGSLKGTLNLALAGGIELGEASDIPTNVLTAMRLPMKTTEQVAQSLARVNDMLSFGANQSNADVRQFGETFKYVAPMASAAGMSIEQVMAAAMVMANNGIKASEAGVALRSALVRMVRPTKDMQAALARYNIDMRDFVRGGRQIDGSAIVATEGINAKPFEAQIANALRDPELQRSLSGLTQRLVEIVGGGSAIDRAKLAETIGDALTAAGSEVDLFGFVKALREKGADLASIARIFDVRQGARLITLLAGANQLERLLERLETEAKGSTDRAARIMQQGVVGAWARFSAAWENLFQAIAKSGVLQHVTDLLNKFAAGIEHLAKTDPETLRNLTYGLIALAGVSPLLSVIGGGLVTLAFGVKMLGGALKMAGLVGAAGTAGAGAAAARKGFLGMMGRALPWAVPGYFAADWAWRKIGGADFVNRLFAERPLSEAQISGRMRALEEQPLPGATITERMREINRRFDEQRATPDSLTGPSIPSMPGEASRAAEETGSAFASGLQDQMERALRMAREYAARIQRELSFEARPRVKLGIDGGELRGLHGDVGVDLAR